MLYLRSILGFEHNISSNRLRVAINVTKIEFELFIRTEESDRQVHGTFTRRTYHLQRHNKKILWINKWVPRDKCRRYRRWEINEGQEEEIKLGKIEGVTIGENYFDVTMTKLYLYIDKRDFWITRYLIISWFLSERNPYDCEQCKVELTRRHLKTECPYLDEKRQF